MFPCHSSAQTKKQNLVISGLLAVGLTLIDVEVSSPALGRFSYDFKPAILSAFPSPPEAIPQDGLKVQVSIVRH
jgi:hypothetical protein